MDGGEREVVDSLETGFDPPVEEVRIRLEMNGFRILGKIVCKGGVVFNGDVIITNSVVGEEEGKQLTKLYEEKNCSLWKEG